LILEWIICRDKGELYMPQLNSPMEILKLLNKSNCRECGETTCLAFAAAVFRGEKHLGQCSHLEGDIIEQYGGESGKRAEREQDEEQALERIKQRVASIDLEAAAERVGGQYANGTLTIKIFGKDFHVDRHGNLSSQIHVNRWVAGPVLSYILESAGKPVSGKWVPFRELAGGKTWYRLFGQRCEKPLKKVADTYTDLFNDMLEIFSGKQVENHYESDISLVLHPLPKVPILICYWKPEDGMESDLNLFFDETAEDNLRIESIFALGTGLVRMFEKIAQTHGA
jgi:hypothetical protein